jgi:hypothetical protein
VIVLLVFTLRSGGIFVFLSLKLPIKGVSFYVCNEFSLLWTKMMINTVCVCVRARMRVHACVWVWVCMCAHACACVRARVRAGCQCLELSGQTLALKKNDTFLSLSSQENVDD